MKRLISLILVFVMVLAFAPAAFASHVHVFGDWRTFRSPTETRGGLDRRYCSCGAYEEVETEELPNVYTSSARDTEKLRSAAIIGVVVGDDEWLSNWVCSQMEDQLVLLTDRHFNQCISIKHEGLGIGSFVTETEHSVCFSAEQFERLMNSREGLGLQLTTARASVFVSPENTEKLLQGGAKDIELNTALKGDSLAVELLIDGVPASVPMTVLTWSKADEKYAGTEDSELCWGINSGVKYVLAYTELDSGSAELKLMELEEEPSGVPMLSYTSNWKLRLGDKFAR